MPEDKNIKHLDGVSMTASEYYYETPADTWDDMKYPEAIKDRYQRVSKLYYRLLKEEMNDPKELTWDWKIRYFKVEQAFKDNKQLLDERSLLI